MDVIDAGVPAARATDPLIERAALRGFHLSREETTDGRVVWEWRRGDEPRPQFVTERVARYWMSEWLERYAEHDG